MGNGVEQAVLYPGRFRLDNLALPDYGGFLGRRLNGGYIRVLGGRLPCGWDRNQDLFFLGYIGQEFQIDAPVLVAGGGGVGIGRVTFALADGDDVALRNMALIDQVFLHRLGAPGRELHVVSLGADIAGVAGQGDRVGIALVGEEPNDLVQFLIGGRVQGCAVEFEEGVGGHRGRCFDQTFFGLLGWRRRLDRFGLSGAGGLTGCRRSADWGGCCLPGWGTQMGGCRVSQRRARCVAKGITQHQPTTHVVRPAGQTILAGQGFGLQADAPGRGLEVFIRVQRHGGLLGAALAPFVIRADAELQAILRYIASGADASAPVEGVLISADGGQIGSGVDVWAAAAIVAVDRGGRGEVLGGKLAAASEGVG